MGFVASLFEIDHGVATSVTATPFKSNLLSELPTIQLTPHLARLKGQTAIANIIYFPLMIHPQFLHTLIYDRHHNADDWVKLCLNIPPSGPYANLSS